MAYDVADDRRRARTAATLEDHGVRVQYSVFECILGDRRLAELQAALGKLIDAREDRISYYRFCSRCTGRAPGVSERHAARTVVVA